MKNRFENYIQSGYTSQFTPTPLDAGMLYNVAKERQSYYDQLEAQLAQLEPKFNYIKANDYDMGHTQQANNVKNFYKEAATNASQALLDDNLEGAKSIMMKSIYNKDMRKQIEGLESAYLQDAEYQKLISSDIKDLGDQQRAYKYYQQNRLKDRNFDEYIGGKSGALGSPILLDNPGLDTKINQLGAAIHSNGYPIGDGRILKALPGPNGKEIYKMYSQDGNVEEIKEKDALNILFTGITSDPQVRDYVAARTQMGDPILYLNDKGEPEGELMNMINAQAAARSFKKTTVDTKIHSDDLELARAKGEIEDTDNTGFERGAATDNFNMKNKTGVVLNGKEAGEVYYKDGKWYKTKRIYDPKYPLRLPTDVPEEDVAITNEINNIQGTYQKIYYKNKEGKTVVEYGNSNKQKQLTKNGNIIVSANDINASEAGAIYNSMIANSQYYPVYEKADKKTEQTEVKNIDINGNYYVREMGEDGNSNYGFSPMNGELMKDLSKADVKMYEGGVAVDVPGVKPGTTRYTAVTADGKRYEMYGDQFDRTKEFEYETIDKLNNFDRSTDKEKDLIPYKVRTENGFETVYIGLAKQPSFYQDETGNIMNNSEGTYSGAVIIKGSKESAQKELDRMILDGSIYDQPSVGELKEQIYKNTKN